MNNSLKIFILIIVTIILFSSCNLIISLVEGLDNYEILILPGNTSVETNETIFYHAVKYYHSNNSTEDISSDILWSTQNDRIASISASGMAYALSEGETVIYAEFEDKIGSTRLYIGFVPEPTPDGTPEPTPDGTPEPTPEWTPEPTIEGTPAPPALPPVITDLGYSSIPRPMWTWSSGGNGIGIFRFKLDDPNLEVGATEISNYNVIPDIDLSEGIHYFYIQEYNADYIWSATASAAVTIDYTSPVVYAGKDRTTGITITPEATVYDDTSGINSIYWYKVDGPGEVTFSDNESVNPAISGSMDGWYIIGLFVDDKAGNGGYDEFTLVIDTSAMAFYPFNGNPADESGNNCHASEVNGPPLVNDRNGHPASAYNVELGYLILPNSNHPNIYNQFTIAGWVSRNPVGTHAFQCFIGKDYSQTYGIGINYSSQKFYIKIGSGTYFFDNPEDPSVPNDNTWHHFAVTFYDMADTVELYYDGNIVRSMICTSTMNPASIYDMGIGKDGRYSDSHQGEIDDIYLYDRVLTPAEIGDIYMRP